jgi:MoaA/NifB/PqqE/SkfB family radical SAM enzyme
MNEPLADPRLPELIRYITDRKKEMTRTKINTNGAYLDEAMGERLIESGLDRLHVSFHGIRRETYEASMGNLSWEKNLENVNRFIELKKKLKAKKPTLKITMVHTKTIDQELNEIREYWNSRGITVNIHAFENRSHSAVEERGLNAMPMKSLSDCDRLMQQAYILWNGDCVLCCVDWERTTVLGNVFKGGLQKVWQNDNYLQFRRNYLAGRVAGTLCAGCKVQDEVDFSYRPKRSLIGKVLGK